MSLDDMLNTLQDIPENTSSLLSTEDQVNLAISRLKLNIKNKYIPQMVFIQKKSSSKDRYNKRKIQYEFPILFTLITVCSHISCLAFANSSVCITYSILTVCRRTNA